MVFSQIRTEQAKDALNQARMRGIEHYVLREDTDWTTLQFTSHYAKLSFDEMARQMGVTIHGDGPTIQMMDALDAVSEGASPNKVLSLLNEAGFTRGMVNAYARSPFKYMCANESCGMSIPSYRGRYPATCPACRGPLITAEQWERRRARRVKEAEEPLSPDQYYRKHGRAPVGYHQHWDAATKQTKIVKNSELKPGSAVTYSKGGKVRRGVVTSVDSKAVTVKNSKTGDTHKLKHEGDHDISVQS